ncbi:rhodanese-like domain-containing protein [Parvimonas micra]
MKKLSRILLLSLITATTLVGCGSKGDNKTAEKQTEKKDDKKSSNLMKGETLLEEQKKGATVIDVRVADQYKEGHIKDAINLPLETIEKDIASKVPKKDTKIVLYCNTGNRSGQAFEKLKKLGYTNVSNAQGVKQYKYDLVK